MEEDPEIWRAIHRITVIVEHMHEGGLLGPTVDAGLLDSIKGAASAAVKTIGISKTKATIDPNFKTRNSLTVDEGQKELSDCVALIALIEGKIKQDPSKKVALNIFLSQLKPLKEALEKENKALNIAAQEEAECDQYAANIRQIMTTVNMAEIRKNPLLN